MEISEDLEKLNNSISILNRTRESLAASACPDSSGHLLDKALAKQISVRKSELDKLLPNSVSVIVRSSTPDPELSCEDNHQNCGQDSSELPIAEDFLLPLNNYLDCILNQTPDNPLQVPPRHPILSVNVNTPGVITNNIAAPREPWTPPRNSPCLIQPVLINRGPRGHLLEILTSPESAPLLSQILSSLNKRWKTPKECVKGS